MGRITLHDDNNASATYVSNNFIDYYMTAANGEYVKIYLYLLRCMNATDRSFSLSAAADRLDHTEKDIQRALMYWEKMKLLKLDYDNQKQLSGIHLLNSVAPEVSAEDEKEEASTVNPAENGYIANSVAGNPAGNGYNVKSATDDSSATEPVKRDYSAAELQPFRKRGISANYCL